MVAHCSAQLVPCAHEMIVLEFAGGGLQHIVAPHACTLGDAQVQAAGDPAQVGVAPPQLVVHAPQWLAVLSAVSHPAAPVQSPNPLLHDAIAQVPLAQVAVALGCVQAIPQPPQLVLVLVAVSQPSVSTEPPEQFA